MRARFCEQANENSFHYQILPRAEVISGAIPSISVASAEAPTGPGGSGSYKQLPRAVARWKFGEKYSTPG